MAATSWFDNIRKFVSSVGQSNQQGDREQQPATTTSTTFNASKLDSSLDSDGGTELRVVASDEEWLLVEKGSVEDGQIVSEDVDSHKPLAAENNPAEDIASMDAGSEAIDAGGLLNAKKKSGSSLSPSLGARSKSVSGSRSPRSMRPSSPSNLQRRASGRGPRPVNLEVQQNGSKHRSSSPSRHNRTESPSRASSSPATKSSLRVKKNASNSGSNSPTFDTPPPSRAQSQSSSQQNSTAAASAVNGTENGRKSEDSSGGGQAFAAKIRDTLRISRPKRKKDKKKKGLAYSVDPVKYSAVEITSKYQDPFETSYAENGEEKTGHGHDFQAVSIPHNKPEYCDHCGDMAWGLYRQVLKCSKCDFVVHRKCEQKVVIDCSSRLESDLLSHDKQVEDVERIAAEEGDDDFEVHLRSHSSQSNNSDQTDARHHHPASSSSTTTTSSSSNGTSAGSGGGGTTTTSSSSTSSSSGPTSAYSAAALTSTLDPQLLSEKTKLARKIREYNRKTTPVHHIHIKSSHNDPSTMEYQGFIRVHMCVQRPIHVSTAITRTSWYRLMRPVKERSSEEAGIETAFYLPTDTNRLVHISNLTTTKELVQILLKKFCVTDNPKKFSLYEEYGGDCRRLFEEDHPLEIALDASCSHRNSKLVLRDNTYSTIQWDAFTLPELTNFIQILQREEEIYAGKVKHRFELWRDLVSQVLKDKCMEAVSRQTQQNIVGNSSPAPSRPTLKVESVV